MLKKSRVSHDRGKLIKLFNLFYILEIEANFSFFLTDTENLHPENLTKSGGANQQQKAIQLAHLHPKKQFYTIFPLQKSKQSAKQTFPIPHCFLCCMHRRSTMHNLKYNKENNMFIVFKTIDSQVCTCFLQTFQSGKFLLLMCKN